MEKNFLSESTNFSASDWLGKKFQTAQNCLKNGEKIIQLKCSQNEKIKQAKGCKICCFSFLVS